MRAGNDGKARGEETPLSLLPSRYPLRLRSTPHRLPTNLFFVLGLAGLKFSSITLNRQLVVYSHLLLLFFFIL